MAILRNIANPQHCIRINRTGGLLVNSDDQARLLISYRYFKTAEDKEAVKQGEQMIWFEDRQQELFNEEIKLPPDSWQPKDPNNYWVEYILAAGYLSMLAHANFANEWISDEV